MTRYAFLLLLLLSGAPAWADEAVIKAPASTADQVLTPEDLKFINAAADSYRMQFIGAKRLPRDVAEEMHSIIQNSALTEDDKKWKVFLLLSDIFAEKDFAYLAALGYDHYQADRLFSRELQIDIRLVIRDPGLSVAEKKQMISALVKTHEDKQLHSWREQYRDVSACLTDSDFMFLNKWSALHSPLGSLPPDLCRELHTLLNDNMSISDWDKSQKAAWLIGGGFSEGDFDYLATIGHSRMDVLTYIEQDDVHRVRFIIHDSRITPEDKKKRIDAMMALTAESYAQSRQKEFRDTLFLWGGIAVPALVLVATPFAVRRFAGPANWVKWKRMTIAVVIMGLVIWALVVGKFFLGISILMSHL